MKIQSLATGDRQAEKLSYIWGVAMTQGSSELNTAMRLWVGAWDTGSSGRTRIPSTPPCNPTCRATRSLQGFPPVSASGRLTRVPALRAGGRG